MACFINLLNWLSDIISSFDCDIRLVLSAGFERRGPSSSYPDSSAKKYSNKKTIVWIKIKWILLWIVGTRWSSSAGVVATGGVSIVGIAGATKSFDEYLIYWNNLNLPVSWVFCCSSACFRWSFLFGSSSVLGAVFGGGFLTRLALPRFSIWKENYQNGNRKWQLL